MSHDELPAAALTLARLSVSLRRGHSRPFAQEILTEDPSRASKSHNCGTGFAYKLTSISVNFFSLCKQVSILLPFFAG